MSIRRFALAALASALIAGPAAAQTLLNVSYDPTRELYTEFNAAFNKHWQAQGHEAITVQQSHGGSGKQARAVIDGLRADVDNLAQLMGISKGTVRNQISAGTFPIATYVDQGKRWADYRDVAGYIDKCRPKPGAETRA